MGDDVDIAPVKCNTAGDSVTPASNSSKPAEICPQQIYASSSLDRHEQANFVNIQKLLKQTLQFLENQKVASAFQSLCEATSIVVQHCERLGLASDDATCSTVNREQFWAGLNNCWLYALAQRADAGPQEEHVMSKTCTELHEKVIDWADRLEHFGLVNYDMGWWETDILAALETFKKTSTI
ncbi:hypothetical protein BC940DRAFT_293242 [Gongronella butleri]|nr:hypothetical protein BC940DRAFT_293242 [Gongronella butleri]